MESASVAEMLNAQRRTITSIHEQMLGHVDQLIYISQLNAAICESCGNMDGKAFYDRETRRLMELKSHAEAIFSVSDFDWWTS